MKSVVKIAKSYQSGKKTPLLQLAQTKEGAVLNFNTGSRKHASISHSLHPFTPVANRGQVFKGTSSIRELR
jgi:hypothetical protein